MHQTRQTTLGEEYVRVSVSGRSVSAQDFLATVLPSTGILCLAEFTTARKEHVFVDSVPELMDAVARFNGNSYDTYFALASFNKGGSRTAINALYLRSAFLDIDCGEKKPYKTKQEAADALDAFLQDTALGALGNPWVVSSGGGLHVYWPFTEDIPVAEWKPVAENLKRLCVQHALAIDPSVTSDAARVLRVPMTSNWKVKDTPRKVKIMLEGARFSFAAFDTALRGKLNGHAVAAIAAPAVELPGVRPSRKAESRTGVLIAENSATSFKDILNKTVAGTGCLQLAHYINNAADDGMEPLWRGLLSISKHCEDGDKASKRLSALHPYSEARMNAKLRDIKGPYGCDALESVHPGVCGKCPHQGKILNPLALGRYVQTDTSEKVVAVPTLPAAQPILLKRPTPPRSFSYGKNGGIYRDVRIEDEEGKTISKQVLVLPYDLFAVDILNNSGEHTVHMLVSRPEGVSTILIPQKAAVSKDETVKALASQNIIASSGAGNDKNLFDYVRGCVEDASVNKKPLNVPPNYGWQADGAFVTNEQVFTPQHTTSRIPMAHTANLNLLTTPCGTLEGWRRFPEMLVARGWYDILALGAGVAFGAPMMAFSGLNGLVFHAGSTESGTGKSLALSMAASVWGHPSRYRVSKNTSAVAAFQRAGLLNSLPLVMDEVTGKSRKDFEWLPEFILDFSDGQAKERMESGANKERVNTSYWASLALLSSNTHVFDYLSGARKHASEGEMRRVLEWTTTEELTLEPYEVEIIQQLSGNFGVAGIKYAKWLAENRNTAQALYKKSYSEIFKDFKCTNDERYWVAGVASCVSGSIAAGSKHAGIVDLPIREMVESYKKIVLNARTTVRSSARTVEDVLNAFTREFYGRFVVVRALNGVMVTTYGDAGIIDESLTRTQVMGRVEHNITPGYIDYYIEEVQLKTYCSSMSFGYSDFRAQLSKLYRVEPIKKDMLSKTKGPTMRVNAVRISRAITTPDDDTAPNIPLG